ncbi:extensin-like domain-containing protein [Porphyrobacter sp. LM 6]|uniref:extensin-like domain-containing protein n=1 Tax=Porphyrobacter sp. LM 6 TaxID=1896196 RepID=UPI000863A3FD|nr:Extensin-like protein C-terminus [Porphyrobacter sp. LM 6]
MMARNSLRAGLLVVAATALTACGSLVPGSGSQSARGADAPATRIGSAPQSYAQRPEDASCLADLGAGGARFTPLPDAYTAPGCNRLGTVQLTALASDRTALAVSNIGPVQCGTAKVFNDWARFGVDRAARQILGSPVARIETMGSYSCRNVAGTERRSAHARAAAIDVSGFVLADGRRIVVKRDWQGGDAATREFLRVVHTSACKRFGTVLGPAYNAAHEDHLHLEGGSGSFCR